MSLGTPPPPPAAGHPGNIAMMCSVSSSVVVESSGACYNTQTTGNGRHDLEWVVCSISK